MPKRVYVTRVRLLMKMPLTLTRFLRCLVSGGLPAILAIAFNVTSIRQLARRMLTAATIILCTRVHAGVLTTFVFLIFVGGNRSGNAVRWPTGVWETWQVEGAWGASVRGGCLWRGLVGGGSDLAVRLLDTGWYNRPLTAGSTGMDSDTQPCHCRSTQAPAKRSRAKCSA